MNFIKKDRNFMFFFSFFQQGPEMIRVSKFYKESKEGKFISYLSEDTRTLYDTFRKGAKESSKVFFWLFRNQNATLLLRSVETFPLRFRNVTVTLRFGSFVFLFLESGPVKI